MALDYLYRDALLPPVYEHVVMITEFTRCCIVLSIDGRKKNLVFSSEIPTAPLDPMLNAQTIIWTKSSQCAYNSLHGVLLY